MRPRPIRSRIYLPETRLGVYLHDWKFIWGFVAVGYLAGKFLPVRVSAPDILGALIGLVAGMSFFTWLRVNRREGWLTHALWAFVSPARFRRRYPSDQNDQGWMKS